MNVCLVHVQDSSRIANWRRSCVKYVPTIYQTVTDGLLSVAYAGVAVLRLVSGPGSRIVRLPGWDRYQTFTLLSIQ